MMIHCNSKNRTLNVCSPLNAAEYLFKDISCFLSHERITWLFHFGMIKVEPDQMSKNLVPHLVLKSYYVLTLTVARENANISSENLSLGRGFS